MHTQTAALQLVRLRKTWKDIEKKKCYRCLFVTLYLTEVLHCNSVKHRLLLWDSSQTPLTHLSPSMFSSLPQALPDFLDKVIIMQSSP